MNALTNWLARRVNRAAERRAAQWAPGSHSPRAVIGLGRWTMLLAVLVFLLWAAFAPLGQGVPAPGVVKVESNRKVIQHQRGGVVEAILVKEGDKVAAGQPLVRLNEVQALAQQGMIESQLIGLSAIEDRLSAERQGLDAITFSRFLTERAKNPQAIEAMSGQRQLFATRRTSVNGEVAILQESIAGLEQQLVGLKAQEQSKAQQLRLYTEELDSLKPVYEQGFVPRSRMFELERAISYLAGGRSEDQATMGRVRSQIAEVRLKALQTREIYRKEVETQLQEAQRQIAELRERSNATKDELSRVVLRAPEAGVVVSLDVHTVGGVIGPGQKLMELVPQGGGLLVELMVPTNLVDNLAIGQTVDMHFPALDTAAIKGVTGSLTYVSADRQTDPKTEASYYVARAKLTAEGEKRLQGHTLVPGMPADAVIKTGERTLLDYMLRPLFNRMRGSLTER